MKRACGVLLPISSLPSKYGIGCFSKEAYKWVDQLKDAGQSYWQILPLTPTSYGDSPYQSPSSFAGNPYFIDLEELIEEGLLTKKECDAINWGGNSSYVDYEALSIHRLEVLKKAFEKEDLDKKEDFKKFVKENESWLEDYAMFMAIRPCFDYACWTEWAEDIRKRWGYSVDYYRTTYKEDMDFYKYIQYLFDRQWKKLKAYANENGIEIVGDIPIYLKDAHYFGAKNLGRGVDYKYPHDYENNYVKQQYLPDEIKNKKYYIPGNNKNEMAFNNYWKNIKNR